jgi:Ca2+-binding EF-hand superfamily protein
MARGERNVERQRKQLAQLVNFEPNSTFQRINRNKNGKITSLEILNFLRSNNFEDATEADTASIVKYFSGHDSGFLDYQDLLQILMTCDDAELRSEICQRNPMACGVT